MSLLSSHFASSGWHRRESRLLAVGLLLVLIAAFAPALPPDAAVAHTTLSDARRWFGLANAADVLSNLGFLAMGAWGLWRLRAQVVPAGTRLFFAGLALTGVVSAVYHLQPDALGLATDRAGMAVAFAGLLGIAAAERVSARAGRWLAAGVLVAGQLAAGLATVNLVPWAVVQFGGMALVIALALTRPVPGARGVRFGMVIAIYALAKAFEMLDAPVFEATHQLISGHTLKHLVAALAGWPVLRALSARHNRAVAAA